MEKPTGPGSAWNGDAAQVEQALAQARALYQAGRLAEAGALCQEALARQPRHAGALNMAGAVALRMNDARRAMGLIEAAIAAAPQVVEYHLNLGQACRAAGEGPRAEAAFREAARLAPHRGEGHYLLGITLLAAGKVDEAIGALRRAVEQNPQDAAAWQNLGAALGTRGQLDESIECFKRAVANEPTDQRWLNLGLALKARGERDAAIGCFQKAVELSPGSPYVYGFLGQALLEAGKVEPAEAAWRKVTELDPKHPWAHFEYARVLQRVGRSDEELAELSEAYRLLPSARLRLHQALVLPTIYASREEMDRWRRRLSDEVGRMAEEGVVVEIDDHGMPNPFPLAYHGHNERELQRRIASLFVPPPGSTQLSHAAEARADGRIRVGFVSKNLYAHTIGLLNHGLIANLSRRDFHVTVITLGASDDEEARAIRRCADRHVELSAPLAEMWKKIAPLGLDVLFFTDIGMDGETGIVALSRLAPVQCVTWGHPLTTGIANLDYFISSELLETGPEAQEHYTEQLVRLKNLAVFYLQPPKPIGDRREFGLPEDKHVYGCPQSLFKLHPDFDEVVAEILRRDPQGIVALIEPAYGHWKATLMRRWSAVMPDVIDRIRFVPHLVRAGFIGLCAASDVLLDPLHFGGGNTSYEAFSVGAPIVTLPSQFLRGRITLALYRQMGVMDCVVSDTREYVELALRLGTDREFRRTISQKILARCGVLYENPAGVRELEEFFRSAVKQAAGRGQG